MTKMIPLRNTRRMFYKTLSQPGYAMRVFAKRFKAYCYYHLGQGKSSPPEAITLFLTHRCNLHCKMCGQWGEGGVTKRQGAQYIREELSLQELTSFIDECASFRPNITLFGGEPLLHAHCLELIRHIKKRRMHCLMITNGSLLEENAEQIVASGLDELNVSLDGGSQLHNQIRGMEGLFESIMSGLTKIAERKIQRHSRTPLVNLQCTISKYNYGHLEQMLDVAKDAFATSLTFHNLIFMEKDRLDRQKRADKMLGCDSLDWEGFVFEPGIDPKLLYAKIKKILSGKHPFSVDFYPNFSKQEMGEYYRDPCYAPSGYGERCLSPWLVAYIFPDGLVRPCLNCSYSFGNIKECQLSALWNGEQAVRFRQLLKIEKAFAVCARCTELYRY